MKLRSRQIPKPGYCYVDDEIGQNLFNLYCGGTERKLQIKNLRKDRCRVHASCEFSSDKFGVVASFSRLRYGQHYKLWLPDKGITGKFTGRKA